LAVVAAVVAVAAATVVINLTQIFNEGRRTRGIRLPHCSPPPLPKSSTHLMTGTPGQIEWAEQIRPRVGAEFDRVAQALEAVARHQKDQARADTHAVIEILKEKRAEVMANDFAGYYIREWQELTDQVRQLIWLDSRYQAIRSGRATNTTRTNL